VLKVNLKASVVICTYNGAPFIEEQLISIFNQTQKVYEVFIFDDRSSDETVEICKEFIALNNLKNWSIIVNKEQSGVFHNFLNGVFTAKGDVIFFSDQDDIWLEDKVELMVNEFKKRPDMLSLTSTFSRFNKNIVLSNHVKHPNRKRNNISKIELNKFCMFPYYLGMSMAISSKLMHHITIDENQKIDITHDIYLNFLSTLNSGLYHLDIVLSKRRSYSGSVSNTIHQNIANEKYNGKLRLYNAYDKLRISQILSQIVLVNISISKSQIETLLKYEKLNQIRYNYLKQESFSGWFKSIIHLQNKHMLKVFLADSFEIFKYKFRDK